MAVNESFNLSIIRPSLYVHYIYIYIKKTILLFYFLIHPVEEKIIIHRKRFLMTLWRVYVTLSFFSLMIFPIWFGIPHAMPSVQLANIEFVCEFMYTLVISTITKTDFRFDLSTGFRKKKIMLFWIVYQDQQQKKDIPLIWLISLNRIWNKCIISRNQHSPKRKHKQVL